MVSENGQTQESKNCVISFIQNFGKEKTQIRALVAWGLTVEGQPFREMLYIL